MISTRTFWVCTFAFAFLHAMGTQAATLTRVLGQASVNRGDGFKPVSGRVALRPGDAISVLADSSVELAFEDGCRTRLDGHEVITIAGASGGLKDGVEELSPCAAPQVYSGPSVAATPAATLVMGSLATVTAATVAASRIASRNEGASP